MKLIQFFATTLLLMSILKLTAQNNVGIGTSTPHASAVLDVTATDKGMLVPRLTSAQRAAIASPATGLLVFDSTTGGFWFYNGSVWEDLSAGVSYTAGPGIAIAGNTISNTGDLNPTDDLNIGSIAGGDVTGSFYNLQISGNAVGTNEIADGSIGTVDLAPGVIPATLPPSGAAGGDLTGTYPNPTVAANAIGSAEITNGSIAAADLGQMNAGLGQVLQWNGTAWVPANAINSLLQDTDGDTKLRLEATPDDDILRVDLAGSERLVIKRNAGAATMLEWPNNGNNIFLGTAAGNGNTTGTNNVALGTAALFNNNTRIGLVAVGDSALFNNGLNATINYESTLNTATGFKSLYSNTTGYCNTANGSNALVSNTTGYHNTANGHRSLFSNTTGFHNTANGSLALFSNITGFDNTANGLSALRNNTTGNYNTANGHWALYSNTTGSSNTANGREALHDNTIGYSNTAIGYKTLENNLDGSYNTALGSEADIAYDSLTNATAIGALALSAASNSMVLGSISGINGATSSVKVGIGETMPSHALTVGAFDKKTMRLIGPTWPTGYGARLNFGDGDFVYIEEPMNDGMRIQANLLGIGRNPVTNRLEVEGAASKTTAGDWIANSDARLKKNIQPLHPEKTLEKLLALQGITYEWNDDKTGSVRPEGIQYGFTAQNIQQVFPSLVETDALGYLQTPYGTYDAMTIEAIRALNEKITVLQTENAGFKALVEMQQKQIANQATVLQKITAALVTAGIGVEE